MSLLVVSSYWESILIDRHMGAKDEDSVSFDDDTPKSAQYIISAKLLLSTSYIASWTLSFAVT